MNNFGYICHDNILRNHIFEDGIHLTDLGTIIFAGNLVDHLNYFVLNKFSNRWLDNSNYVVSNDTLDCFASFDDLTTDIFDLEF